MRMFLSGQDKHCLRQTGQSNTGEQTPIRQKARHVGPVAEEAIEKEVAQMKEKGVIVESHRPWSSPVGLVKKKNGEVRFFVDFIVLNEHTVKDSYPYLESTKHWKLSVHHNGFAPWMWPVDFGKYHLKQRTGRRLPSQQRAACMNLR
jgi:hypothetical protein